MSDAAVAPVGKNFSCNAPAASRRKADFYETPYSMTRKFLQAEGVRIPALILEPAAGAGAIVRVLQEYPVQVVAYDLQTGTDFLEETTEYPGIITNPPYRLAMEFIQRAKQLTPYFAFLLPLSYLHGKKRHDLVYADAGFPLARVYVFTRYPMLGDPLREDGKYRTGMMVYAWFVWEKGSRDGHPEIHWIDNNDDILRKGRA